MSVSTAPQVHSTKNMPDFEKWQEFLRNKGYHNFWQDLNAKNYGVAQNRNRCFMISLLQDIHYSFPKPIPLTKKMKDYLEDEVDEKYYINNDKAKSLIQKLIDNNVIPNDRKTVDLTTSGSRQLDVSSCIASRYDAGICRHKLERSGVFECVKKMK
jgi:DNA (cytosine-5)-methyltransferase 1